jgi:hypothetical protein
MTKGDSDMKKTMVIVLVVGAFGNTAQARYIEGINWADRVVSYTGKVQSWTGGQSGGPEPTYMDCHTPATTWWVLGPNDADGNGDLYAWDFDLDDRDYVGGWKGKDADQELIVQFDTGIRDIEGDDLIIRLYCGPIARASVWASIDGNDFTQIGTIRGQLNEIPGLPGELYDAVFDLSGLFTDDVHFIRVFREVAEPKSGMFFDSFSSAYIDVPSDCNEVVEFGWTLAGDINQDCCVNHKDLETIESQWQMCNDPNDPDFDESLFDDPNSIPSSCHGVWQAGLGLAGDINHDCRVDSLDLAVFVEEFLACTDPNDADCIVTWQ